MSTASESGGEIPHAGRVWADRDGGVAWCDDLARLHGYRHGEARPSVALLTRHEHPDDRGALRRLLDEALGGAGVRTSRHRILDRGDTVRAVGVIVEPIRSPDAGAAAIGHYLDLTQTGAGPGSAARILLDPAGNESPVERAVAMMMLVRPLTAGHAHALLHGCADEIGCCAVVLARRLVAESMRSGMTTGVLALLHDRVPGPHGTASPRPFSAAVAPSTPPGRYRRWWTPGPAVAG